MVVQAEDSLLEALFLLEKLVDLVVEEEEVNLPLLDLIQVVLLPNQLNQETLVLTDLVMLVVMVIVLDLLVELVAVGVEPQLLELMVVVVEDIYVLE